MAAVAIPAPPHTLWAVAAGVAVASAILAVRSAGLSVTRDGAGPCARWRRRAGEAVPSVAVAAGSAAGTVATRAPAPFPLVAGNDAVFVRSGD